MKKRIEHIKHVEIVEVEELKKKTKQVELIQRTEQPLRYGRNENNWSVRTNETHTIGRT